METVNKVEEFRRYFSEEEVERRENEYIKKVTSSREAALAFLMEVGLVDENGNPKEPYK